MFYGYQSSVIHASMNIHLDIHGFLQISMHWLAMDPRSREVPVWFCVTGCYLFNRVIVTYRPIAVLDFIGWHVSPWVLRYPISLFGQFQFLHFSRNKEKGNIFRFCEFSLETFLTEFSRSLSFLINFAIIRRFIERFIYLLFLAHSTLESCQPQHIFCN